MSALRVAPGFRWPDVVKVRRAARDHVCQMPRENPVIEVRSESGAVRRQRQHAGRPSRFRRWDGGPIPAGHTPTICRGSLYVEYFGEAAAYQAGDRYCRECAVAAGMVVEAKR